MKKINSITLAVFLVMIALGNYGYGGLYTNFKEMAAEDGLVESFIEEDTTSDCELTPGAGAKPSFDPVERNIYTDFPDYTEPVSHYSPNSIGSVSIPNLPGSGNYGRNNGNNGGGGDGDEETTTVTPEPATIAVFAAGLGLIPLYRKRKANR